MWIKSYLFLAFSIFFCPIWFAARFFKREKSFAYYEIKIHYDEQKIKSKIILMFSPKVNLTKTNQNIISIYILYTKPSSHGTVPI